jgi:hypothetical protein
MGIKDPYYMNLVMGVKLVWRLIAGKVDWWKKDLWKKYFRRRRKICIVFLDENQRGSQLWKLVKVAHSIIHCRSTLIPGNIK